MAKSAYPIDPALTAIAIAYKNANYIADQVLPRIMVAKQEFTFLQYATDQNFNIPETRVGRRSKPNEVSLTAEEVTDSTNDEALDGGVPNSDIDNADARYDPLGTEVAFLQELIALAREARAAGPGVRRRHLCRRAEGDVGRRHPVQRRRQQDGDRHDQRRARCAAGSAEPDGVRTIWLDPVPPAPRDRRGVLRHRRDPRQRDARAGGGSVRGRRGVGRRGARQFGQARPGGRLTRLWGKHLALTHKAPVPDAKGAVTFGGTFQFGGRVAGQWEDKNIGMRGGVAVRTGESVKERIIASQAGYFFENAFA